MQFITKKTVLLAAAVYCTLFAAAQSQKENDFVQAAVTFGNGQWPEKGESSKLDLLQPAAAVKYVAKKAGVISQSQSNALKDDRIISAADQPVNNMMKIPAGYIIGFVESGKVVHVMISFGNGVAYGTDNLAKIGIGKNDTWESIRIGTLIQGNVYNAFSFRGKTFTLVCKSVDEILNTNSPTTVAAKPVVDNRNQGVAGSNNAAGRQNNSNYSAPPKQNNNSNSQDHYVGIDELNRDHDAEVTRRKNNGNAHYASPPPLDTTYSDAQFVGIDEVQKEHDDEAARRNNNNRQNNRTNNNAAANNSQNNSPSHDNYDDINIVNQQGGVQRTAGNNRSANNNNNSQSSAGNNAAANNRQNNNQSQYANADINVANQQGADPRSASNNRSANNNNNRQKNAGNNAVTNNRPNNNQSQYANADINVANQQGADPRSASNNRSNNNNSQNNAANNNAAANNSQNNNPSQDAYDDIDVAKQQAANNNQSSNNSGNYVPLPTGNQANNQRSTRVIPPAPANEKPVAPAEPPLPQNTRVIPPAPANDKPITPAEPPMPSTARRIPPAPANEKPVPPQEPPMPVQNNPSANQYSSANIPFNPMLDIDMKKPYGVKDWSSYGDPANPNPALNQFAIFRQKRPTNSKINNVVQYVTVAYNFYRNHPVAQELTLDNGDLVLYDGAINLFAVYDQEGKPKEMYCPDSRDAIFQKYKLNVNQ